MAEKPIITELTPEQEAAIPGHVEKWLKIGLSTEPMNKPLALQGVREAYENAKLRQPHAVVFMASPVGCALCAIALDLLDLDTGLEVCKEIDGNKDIHEVLKVIKKNIGTKKYKEFHKNFKDNIPRRYNEICNAFCFGQHDSGWLSFYAYFHDVLGLKEESKDFSGLWKIAQAASWWLPYENVAIVSDRPKVLAKNDSGLHRDLGKAIEYRDGWGLYFLNGVNCEEKIVMTPAEDLDPKSMLKIDNAEQRREFVRKVGMLRICKALNAKVLDKSGDYELLMLDAANNRRPYLKMVNPSIGTEHIEGVPTNIKTVAEALRWRNKIDDNMVDENGEDWYQQGDVVIKPRGAKKLKPEPTILT